MMTMQAPPHTTEEAANLAGVTFRQLDYWTTQGIVSPSLWLGESGSGSARRWSDADIVRIGTASRLIKLGLTHQLITIAVASDAQWLGVADGIVIEQMTSADELLAFVGRYADSRTLTIIKHMARLEVEA